MTKITESKAEKYIGHLKYSGELVGCGFYKPSR